MNYSIEMLENDSIMYVQFRKGFGKDDLQSYLDEARALYAAAESPVYQILNIEDLALGFDDIMEFLSMSFRGERNATKHPMNRGTLIVTKNVLYQMMARGLTHVSFGSMKIQVFESLEAAQTWINNQAT
ncbi:MAG: hypothetical protein KC496_17450 [Anaerolineae bacterium]|nr:hypothetical protein [Anaerolineae bacterium]